MPAISNISFIGGMDFIIPDRKFAVAVFPSAPVFPPSQTVTLSILRFFIASTWIFVSSSSLSAIMSLIASFESPPADLTISAKPSACFVSIERIPSASACILMSVASDSPFARRLICSASASALSSSCFFSISALTMTSASRVACSRVARACSAAFCAE